MENMYTVNVKFVIIEELIKILKENKDLDNAISDKERLDIKTYNTEKTRLAIASESSDPLIDMEIFLVIGTNDIKPSYSSISKSVSAMYPILLVSYSFSNENIIIKGDIKDILKINPKLKEEPIRKIFEITFANKSFTLII